MKEYKNILIATKIKLNFEPLVGVFLISRRMQLIGEAELHKKGKNLYADFKVEMDIEEYYPQIKYINTIDSLILTSTENTPLIKSIGEQLI